MPVGSIGARLGHLRAAGGGQRDGVVGGDHAGDRVGGDLADGVAGRDEVTSGQQAALGQLLLGKQRRGHDQRLGHGGVGDLLGRRGGAEAARSRPLACDQVAIRSAAPGSSSHEASMPGGLRSLSGSKQCEHVFKRTLWERICAV